MKTVSTFRILFISFSSMDEARTCARTLLDEKLAACCSILPGVTSLYIWKNEIQEQQECMMMLKTTSDNTATCEERIRQIHSYEVPEILSVRVDEIHEPYSAWMLEVLTRPGMS